MAARATSRTAHESVHVRLLEFRSRPYFCSRRFQWVQATNLLAGRTYLVQIGLWQMLTIGGVDSLLVLASYVFDRHRIWRMSGCPIHALLLLNLFMDYFDVYVHKLLCQLQIRQGNPVHQLFLTSNSIVRSRLRSRMESINLVSATSLQAWEF